MKIQNTMPSKDENKSTERRPIKLKLEKVTLKTGLRAGIHDTDRYG